MSDLSRALRKAEDQLTYALVEEMLHGPDPRLSGFREVAKHCIIRLRELADNGERYEDAEAVGGNIGGYAP